jgi:hypothetical protein
MAAMLLGLLVIGVEIAFGDSIGFGHTHLTTVIAALIGAPIGLIGGIVVSLAGPVPSAAELIYFEEMRDPRGDALYDRARRRAAATATATAAATATTPANP